VGGDIGDHRRAEHGGNGKRVVDARESPQSGITADLRARSHHRVLSPALLKVNVTGVVESARGPGVDVGQEQERQYETAHQRSEYREATPA
jgi:hypothetical protein